MMRSAPNASVALATLSAAILAIGMASPPAMAAEGTAGNGPYFRAFGGYSVTEDPNLQGDNISNGAVGPGISRGEMSSSGGFMGGGAGGYRWGILRLEGMGTYESHELNSFTTPQLTYRDLGGTLRTEMNTAPSLSGNMKIFTGFVNAMLDVDFGYPVQPFFGGGVGFAHVNMDNVTGTSRGNTFRFADGSDTVLAFHALIGVAYKITPMFTAEIGYRYLTLNDASFTDSTGGNFDVGIDSHQVFGGLRLNF
jgi:opacity protein-like surface antigen